MKFLEFLLSLFTKHTDVDEAETIEQTTKTPVVETPTVTPTPEVETYSVSTAEPLLSHNKYNNVVVFLDHGHCKSTPGKCSPDKRLLEYAYAREIVRGIEAKLDKLGVKYWNDHPEDDFVIKSKGSCKDLDSRDLVLRVARINEKYTEVKRSGNQAFLISVHVNAKGSDGKWHDATGWETYTTVGQNNSDKLAECMYDAAEQYLKPLNKRIRTDMSDSDRDKESNLYILKHSNCPCTLTENFFQDTKDDVDWLLSDEGKQTIIDLHVKGILNYLNKIV